MHTYRDHSRSPWGCKSRRYVTHSATLRGKLPQYDDAKDMQGVNQIFTYKLRDIADDCRNLGEY